MLAYRRQVAAPGLYRHLIYQSLFKLPSSPDCLGTLNALVCCIERLNERLVTEDVPETTKGVRKRML